jgi:hypothetical protein
MQSRPYCFWPKFSHAPPKLFDYLEEVPVSRHVQKQRCVIERGVFFLLTALLRWPEMYMLSGAPFARNPKGHVLDRARERVKLLGDSSQILHQLATESCWEDTAVVGKPSF